jgi:hypothetical protein
VDFRDYRGWHFDNLWQPVAACGGGVLPPKQAILQVWRPAGLDPGELDLGGLDPGGLDPEGLGAEALRLGFIGVIAG